MASMEAPRYVQPPMVVQPSDHWRMELWPPFEHRVVCEPPPALSWWYIHPTIATLLLAIIGLMVLGVWKALAC